MIETLARIGAVLMFLVGLAVMAWVVWDLHHNIYPALRRYKERQRRLTLLRVKQQEADRLAKEGRYVEALAVLHSVMAELDQIDAELREEKLR